MSVPGCPAHRPLTQAGPRVAFGLDSPLLPGSAGRMQQFAILGREQEDQAIDDPQKLLEISMSAECTFAQRLTESAIGRVLDETMTKFEQGRLDALAQLVARGHPIGAA